MNAARACFHPPSPRNYLLPPMGETPDPSPSTDDARTSRRISPTAATADSPSQNKNDAPRARPFNLSAAVGWGVATIFALATMWFAQKQASARLEITALESIVELEQAASQALRNELEAERLLTVRQAEEFKKLEATAATLRTALASERNQANPP